MSEKECIRQASVNMVFTSGTLSAYNDRIEFHSNNGKKNFTYYYYDIIGFSVELNTVLNIKFPEDKVECFAFDNEAEANQWLELVTELKANNLVNEPQKKDDNIANKDASEKEYPKENNLKFCSKCGKELFDDAATCENCGNSVTDLVVNDELNKKKKQNKIAVGVILGAFLFVILVLVLSFCLPESTDDNSKTDTNNATTSDILAQGEEVSDSVLWYPFDNTMEEAIEKYRGYEEEKNDLTNIIDDVSAENFEYIDDYHWLVPEGEVVSCYTYIYYNKETAISLFVNEKEEVVGIRYIISTDFLDDLEYSGDEAVEEQLYRKPARWIASLSETLTFDDAYGIYRGMFEESSSVCYSSGYTMCMGTLDNIYAFDILRTNYKFPDYFNETIKPYGTLIHKTQTTVDNKSQGNISNILTEVDTDEGLAINMNPERLVSKINEANEALGLDESYNVDSSLLPDTGYETEFGTTVYDIEIKKIGEVSDGYLGITTESSSDNVIGISFIIYYFDDMKKEAQKEMENRVYSMIKMLNPELEYSKLEELMLDLYASNDKIYTNFKSIYYNNVAYMFSQDQDNNMETVLVKPMTEDYYNSKVEVSADVS